MTAFATIRGIPNVPTVTEINVRSGPTTTALLVSKRPVGLSGLQIANVLQDSTNAALNGKVYQWFQLVFPDGSMGWVRDDLIEVEGDLTNYGYGIVRERSFAFALTRQAVMGAGAATPAATLPTPAPAVSPTPAPAVTPTPPAATPPAPQPAAPVVGFDLARVKKASFAVTAAFEGTGYAAYNNYDAGIISYGLIQFTLAAGSLNTVVEKYLAYSTSPNAQALAAYRDRIASRDANLRGDTTLKQILLNAANEPEMRQAQDEVASVNYWDKVVEGYITPRGLKLPLTYALLFDMGVNFGTGHGFVRLAEEQLGVPVRSRPGENGITEEQLMLRVAELRRDSHYRQAERDNLPGLKARGDFWLTRIQKGDWGFVGEGGGFADVNGRKVQIANP